jgi:vitamin B12 transporter
MVSKKAYATRLVASSLLITAISGPLLAEESPEMETMLVTAGLQEMPIYEVSSSVTVITAQDIKLRQVKYLSDLLRDVPGFAVSQAGGPGTQTQVRVRGAEANQLLVLIDGVRANDPAQSDEFPYQFALAANIERIEIIRGPQSAIWGSDAMAGVINIIRKKNVDSQYVAAQVEGGSFGTFSGSVDAGYAADKFQINGGFGYFDSDGTNISREGNEKDGTQNKTANLDMTYNASDAINLSFSGQVVDASNDFDDIDFVVTGLPIDADRVTESQQTYLTANIAFAPEQGIFSTTFSVNWTDSDIDNFADGNWSGSTAADTLDLRLHGGWKLDGVEGLHRLNFALEYEDVDFSQRGEALPWGDPNQDQGYDNNGYALEYVGKPLPGLSWTASARYDDYSDFDNATTWQLGASYQVNPGVRLRGSVGTGYKAPTFTERFGYYEATFIGNPDLKPETSLGWEVGIDTSWNQDRSHFQLAYFDQDLKDEIDGFVFDLDTFLFTAENKENDSQRHGIEAVFDTRLSDNFSIDATYTYTDSTEKDAQGSSIEEVRRPKNIASLNLNYYFAEERGNLNINANYTGKQLDIFFSPITYLSEIVELPAFTVIGLASSWKLNQTLELTARVSNLFDKEYEEILGFVRPGRAFYAGIRGHFDL